MPHRYNPSGARPSLAVVSGETQEFLRGIRAIEVLVQAQSREFVRYDMTMPAVDPALAEQVTQLSQVGCASLERLLLLTRMVEAIVQRKELLDARAASALPPIAVDAFVGAAHKIRTVLDVVLNCSEEIVGIAADQGAIEDTIDPAKEMAVAARWAALYAEELADLALLDREGAPTPTCFSASEVATTVVGRLAPLAIGAGIGVTLSEGTQVTLESDRHGLQRCLQYLMLLVLGGRKVANVAVDVRALGDEAFFTIADDGEGASLAQLARLVGASRPDAGQDADAAGFAVARRLANRFGGRISFERRPGLGSRVELSAPLKLP